ncbi:hypothetical protein PghCCS26_55520 [Paenibacillus glycanilyticus]|uniref:Transposase n=1 Tax=Paenibacillus glycanilyticus TaxID=126569 RepID=A0ABQ6NWA5_9BACL|nr:hypothetical protein PghCCS26_55520 [Paenibacillus glycanilyticus]
MYGFFHVEQLVGLIIKKKEMKQGFWHRRECFKWCFTDCLTHLSEIAWLQQETRGKRRMAVHKKLGADEYYGQIHKRIRYRTR